MKSTSSLRGLALVLLASLATTAQAASSSVIFEGNNGPTGSLNSSGSIAIPATCSVTCYVEITLSGIAQGQGGGGGCGVGRGSTFVVSTGAGGGAPGTYTNTNAVYNQPAGTYSYGLGFSGPPNTVDGYIDITFSW